MSQRNRGLKISTILQVLFGVLIATVIGCLAIPMYGAVQQRAAASDMVEYARGGRAVFVALQAVRSERGPTRVALAGANPASQSFIDVNAKLHGTADAAMTDVLRYCAHIDCIFGKLKSPLTGLWVNDGTRTHDPQNHNLMF